LQELCQYFFNSVPLQKKECGMTENGVAALFIEIVFICNYKKFFCDDPLCGIRFPEGMIQN